MATHEIVAEALTDYELDNHEKLFSMVLDENVRQLKKWGVQSDDKYRWLAWLSEEVGELNKAINDGESDENITNEAIQVATLALKIAENFIIKLNLKCLSDTPTPIGGFPDGPDIPDCSPENHPGLNPPGRS